MTDIRSRGKLPLLVGGTMLYFKALWDGLDDMPTASPALRAELAEQAAVQGWPALHAELARVDPLTAARLQPQDSQRISRALEVFRASGRPMSFFQRRIAPTQPAMEAVTAPAGLLISLEPDNRAWLHQRIAQRFDAMLAAGFLDEVRSLRARADLHPDLPAMRCVGYRQAWTLLDNLDTLKTPKEVQQAELDFREQGIAATRQLAKRQLTWLRSMPQRRVVACDTPDTLAQVLALTAQCAGATG
jgi:tRNA dimethylallyltransferase